MAYLKPPWFTSRIFNRIAMATGLSGSETLTITRRSSGTSQQIPVITIVVDGTNGHVGIGVQAGPALRKLHVEGSEVHSGGPAGGFSFADRSVKKFVEKPAAGERWVWYCSHGTATLWSGADKLTVTTKGELQVGGANGVRITATQIVATTGKTIPLHGPAGTPTTQIPEQIELIGEVVKLRELVRDLQEQVSALKAKKP